MLSIQTVTAAKNRSIVAAILLACVVVGGCSNKEQSAYRLAAQAQQQLEGGDVLGARLSIDKALRERDDLVELHLLKARIELKGKSIEAAFISFYNALSLDPVNQEALQSVTMLGLQTGHTVEAEDAASKLLALSPRNPTALLVKGLLALERSRYDEAMTAADAIIAGSPTDEGAVILKARSLYLSGKPTEAKALVTRIRQLAGPGPGIGRITLEIARADQDAAGMLKAIDELRSLREDDAQLVVDEANVRYKTGDMKGASQLVESALSREQTSPEQAARLIDLWREYDPVAPTRATIMAVRNPAIRELLARYLIERERYAEAQSMLPATTGSSGGLIARIQFGTGQVDAARRTAETVIEQDPSQCDARIALAELALREGNREAAVTNGQQAAAECPLQADGALVAARAYSQIGQAAQANRVYRDAINRSPADLKLHATFVSWLLSNGNAESAAGVARHLIRYAPNRISSWQLLARACGSLPCREDAEKGLAQARSSFFMDRKPDEPRRRGLFESFGGGVARQ